VHIAPLAFAQDVPYQVAIVEFEDGSRVTARIDGRPVKIGDHVVETRQENGICFFQKPK